MAKVTFTGSWRKIHSCCCHGMRVNSLSDFEERLFWRLNLVADDYGVFHAEPRIVKGACIPLLDRPVKDVQDALDNLEKSGLIWIFCSQECQYLRICDFERFQSAPNGKRVHRFIEPAEINSLCNPEKSRKIQTNPTNPNTTDQNRTGIEQIQNRTIPASANAEPHPSSSVVEKPSRRPREADPVWDVVAELYFGSNVVLDSQKKKCGMIVRDLKKLGATPDEIRRRKANIPESWTLPGPTALVGHWSELDKPQTKGTQNGSRIEKSGPNGFTRIQEDIDLSCIIRR